MAAAGITGVLTLCIFVWGVQLTRGRLLNTIAGNNLVTKEECDEPRQIGLGKRVGRTMISASVLTCFLTLALIFDSLGNSNLYSLFLSLMYFSIVPLLAFAVFSFRWSLRNMK